MRQTTNLHPAQDKRRNERGAALITMLLVSMLLLVAGGALVLSTAMTAQGSFDSTAEVQAYYGAEAGLQATLSVLRGNVQPNPTFATNPTGGYATLNKLNFRDAVTPDRSNKSGETAFTNPRRLSRWLPYDATNTDRVIVSPTTGYTTLAGIAYSVVVSDPDDPTGSFINPLSAAFNLNYQPTRLLVEVTGYGPRGARKQLSMMVGGAMFNIQPPAPIVIRGADDGSSMTFDLGNSNAKTYTGVDNAGVEPIKPTVAFSLSDWKEAHDGIHKPETVNDPEVSVLDYFNYAAQTVPTIWPTGNNWKPYPLDTSGDGRTPPVLIPQSVVTPDFLRTAANARAFLFGPTGLMEIAKLQGRYVSSYSGMVGSSTDPDFLFVDGDCELDGGAGLLVVTGTLNINGNDDFNGIILVMGGGTVTRSGGGNGNVLGSWIVARFNRTSGDFLAPSFDVSGGGNSNFKFDSSARDQANRTGGRAIVGVVEK